MKIKYSGILRVVDSAKRVNLPASVLEQMEISAGDTVEIFTGSANGECVIIIKKKEK